jgi:hypothetical protein
MGDGGDAMTGRGAALAMAVAGAALVAWALAADAHWAERHVLASYCATGPAGWALARGVRLAAGALGAVALVWLAPAAARRAPRAGSRPGAAAVLGVALAVGASLAVVELYLRHLHDRLVQGDRGSMARADPRLGWAYVPRRTTWVELGGRRVAYAIDAAGDRAASPDALPDRARPTVLFAGESIAFGYGLSYDETLPALVAHDLGVQAVNLAVVGYGNDQAYLRVVDALARHARPLAVVTVFVPDQVRRNVDGWRPRLALAASGGLELVPPWQGPRLLKLAQELPYHGDEALRVTGAVLRATADAARARGAFPLFVVTNYGAACLHADGEEPWVVDQLFVRQGLPFTTVTLDPDDRLPGAFERHPGPRGARKLADAVVRELRARLSSR